MLIINRIEGCDTWLTNEIVISKVDHQWLACMIQRPGAIEVNSWYTCIAFSIETFGYDNSRIVNLINIMRFKLSIIFNARLAANELQLYSLVGDACYSSFAAHNKDIVNI